MVIRQISVFIQNEKGRLLEIATALRDAGVDIRALSLADTTDFGILRLIVDRPEAAEAALRGAGHTVSITQVIAIGVSDRPGGLCEALEVLSANEISVEYMYAFISRAHDQAYVIIRVSDNDRAVECLSRGGVKMLCKQDIIGGA